MCCALPATLAAQQPPAAGDWPHWRGLNHDGLSTGAGWSAQGNTVWSKDVGLGYSGDRKSVV